LLFLLLRSTAMECKKHFNWSKKYDHRSIWLFPHGRSCQN